MTYAMNKNLYRNNHECRKAWTDQLFAPFCKSVSFGDPEEFAEVLFGRFVVEDFEYSDDLKYWTVHQYLQSVVLPHKTAVYMAGMEMAKSEWFMPFVRENMEVWQDNLWLHDISKFSANETFGYAFHDFKKKYEKLDVRMERAWLHHKNHNEHHPEYWLSSQRSGEIRAFDIPRIYLVEMVADWIGAGKVYGNTLEHWLPENLHTFFFHTKTAEDLAFLLLQIGIETEPVNENQLRVKINQHEERY
jgi:hypothetical protein